MKCCFYGCYHVDPDASIIVFEKNNKFVKYPFFPTLVVVISYACVKKSHMK